MRFIGNLIVKLQRHPKRIVFPEGTEPRILQAARQFYSLRLGAPILLGDRTVIKAAAERLNVTDCGRIPIRTNRDDRYLSEKFQALPTDGYTAMFEKMLAHPKIEVRLNTDYRAAREQMGYDHLIFTGPIDEYYDHCFGHLPYRSIRFEPETLQQEYFQPAMQVNYPNDHDFTRIVEIKHATGQKLPSTTIVREYPQDYGHGREPYYPIPAPDAKALYQKYADRAASEKNVTFVGRLATYRYYNMDQVIGMALNEFDRIKENAK